MRRRKLRLVKGGRNGFVKDRLYEKEEEAIIILPIRKGQKDAEWMMSELSSLCRSADLVVAHKSIQCIERVDSRTLVGRGKVKEITEIAHSKGIDLVVFGTSLTPSQQRNIALDTGLRVIDRNQLILGIFAKHARSRDGKIQIELAQLRYNLPRLSEKDDSLSRLTGGIGAIGPGETKLEMERRRARERIRFLEAKIEKLSEERAARRKRRLESNIPMVALVGYTNAGKSTIFNTLTKASVPAQDKMFATLDPTIRRVRLEDGSFILLCDTVGFIRDLPRELTGAFRATIEEVSTASGFILVVDSTDPHIYEQVLAVKKILGEMGFLDRPMVTAISKIDLVKDESFVKMQSINLNGIPVCGYDRESLVGVLRIIRDMIENHKKS